MAITLRNTIVVRDPETYEPVALIKDQECPEWAVPLVHRDELDGLPDPEAEPDDEADKAAAEAAAKEAADKSAAEAAAKDVGSNQKPRAAQK